jgi:hypothetical protein
VLLLTNKIYCYLDIKKLYILSIIFEKKKVDIKQATKIVIEAISDILKRKTEIFEDMQLIGGDSLLDSMNLVEVCLLLEDIAEEHGFEFDWTSEAAMSKSRSMFRTVSALAKEFANQSEV